MIRLVSSAFLDSSRTLRAIARGTTAVLAAATALATLAACGDPLVTASYRGDPIFSVRGSVTKGALESAPILAQEVGVLWLHNTNDGTVHLEATPADAIGNQLPAGFDVSVLNAPSDASLGIRAYQFAPRETLNSLDDGEIDFTADGQPFASDVVEDSTGRRSVVDPSRIGLGVVVVADAGTFAQLPASIGLHEDGGLDGLMSNFTYVSPFFVRYVKGAEDEGLTLVPRDGATGLPVEGAVGPSLRDFTIIDATVAAKNLQIHDCVDRALQDGRLQEGFTEDEQARICGSYDRSGDVRRLGVDDEVGLALATVDIRDTLSLNVAQLFE